MRQYVLLKVNGGGGVKSLHYKLVTASNEKGGRQ